MSEHNETNDSPIAGLALLGYVFGALLVILAAGVGGVDAADVELQNATVSVIEDTDTMYAEINNTTATTDANVSVEWIGIEGENETSLNTQDVVVTNQSLDLFEEPVNGSAYESVRVVATLDNSTVPAENVTVEIGTPERTWQASSVRTVVTS